MPTATYGLALQIGGVSIQKSIIRTADGQAVVEDAAVVA